MSRYNITVLIHCKISQLRSSVTVLMVASKKLDKPML